MNYKKRRVVITGIGAITSIGNNIEEFWKNIKDGKHGFNTITRFDASNLRCKIAAEVKNFDVTNYMNKRTSKRMSLFSQYAIASAKEALLDSGVDMTKEDPYLVGCMISSSAGSFQDAIDNYITYIKDGEDSVQPTMIPLSISNMASSNVSIELGLKGKNLNIATSCASSNNTIGEAFRSIQYGECDLVFAGGAEGSISECGIVGFDALNALSDSDDINKCCIPFDKDRRGFVMGEGSAVAVLEELEHAINRGAKIYAEVLGYGNSADAYHITRPSPDCESVCRAMENAIADANIEKKDITYINAHGTGTYYNDLYETKAIKNVFKENTYNIKINSTKSFVGHMLGAAGAIEFITSILEIRDRYIHKTLGFCESDEEMDLDYCKTDYNENVQYALSNSFGFGGHNACLVVGKYN